MIVLSGSLLHLCLPVALKLQSQQRTGKLQTLLQETLEEAQQSQVQSSSSPSSQPIGTNTMSARARLLANLPLSSRDASVSGLRRLLVESPESESSDKKGSNG
ncbi:hypothetical protein M378DRAFT_765674 [Amanita muscaria Koide BX008]|uniref:Uncharacterized protein n=1 Tax=Amanita muscaria (strain Koide BX008) TaxID=946122 RepID=A0A0C2XJB2_AMAMK|nr:hypothetical protein M378DRAFT_765674 [Amanita muscaria Koide BX008]